MHPMPLGRPLDPGAPRRAAAIELGLLQGLFVGYLLPWFFLAIGGTMGLGDSGSSWVVPVILAWWIYPFVALGTTIAAWVLFGMRRHGPARWVNRVPLLWVVVGVALIVWIVVAG
jgi:hypothetical protein